MNRATPFYRYRKIIGLISGLSTGGGGFTVGLALATFFAAIETWNKSPLGSLIVLFAVSGSFWMIGTQLYILGRRTSALALLKFIESRYPEVLYLRPFRTAGLDLRIREGPSSFWRAVLASPEEAMLNSLWVLGAVATIGRPKDPLPSLGAAPIYLGDSDWQVPVADYIRNAKWIVIRISNSNQLLWEIITVAKLKHPSNILLWFPPEDTWGDEFDGVDWETIQHDLESGLGTMLPPIVPRGHFVYFSSPGNPHVAPTARPFLAQQGVPKRAISPMTWLLGIQVACLLASILGGCKVGTLWLSTNTLLTSYWAVPILFLFGRFLHAILETSRRGDQGPKASTDNK
jgi:hypothetical protein